MQLLRLVPSELLAHLVKPNLSISSFFSYQRRATKIFWSPFFWIVCDPVAIHTVFKAQSPLLWEKLALHCFDWLAPFLPKPPVGVIQRDPRQ